MTMLAENPVADFSDDTIWVVLGKALFIFVFLVVGTILMIWAERRVVARMQSRPGPNRFGPFGLLQPLADGVKLILKEDITPRAVDRVVFVVAPIISGTAAFLAFSVIPFGPEARIPFTDIRTPLQLTDLPIALLFILAAAAVGVYGIVLGGWSSGSTYPLLGGLRSSAQVISYEIAMALALVSVFLYSGSMSTSAIVDAQASGGTAQLFGMTLDLPSWHAITLLPSFVIYCIAMVGETNRAPFDLPEAEGELVGGYHTEYSSTKFLLFFLAEYVNMFTVSAIATTLFLGGWRAPFPLSLWDGANHGWWPMLWFVLKVAIFMFCFIWLRGTLPRLRYDQFMALGWKWLIPAALGWTLVVAGLRATQQFESVSTQKVLIGVAAVIAALLVVVLFIDWLVSPEERRQPRQAAEPQAVDPFAGGYPVPPMPGQRLARTSGPVLVAQQVPAAGQDTTDEEQDSQPGEEARRG
ncbi:MAG: NADH-quinone oxidoreductase subunit NuoH [Actinomycetales bacterium]|nr:NADH-quinone oxidoreductase subunit NuoH [Actinomycetales bacterium]